MTDIDDSVRYAAELLVREHGVADAIAELQARADAGRDGDTDRSSGGFKNSADGIEIQTIQDEKTEAGAVGGTSPPACRQDNATYSDRSNNSTDRRTGLRTTTDHYSWRQVYAACHVSER